MRKNGGEEREGGEGGGRGQASSILKDLISPSD